MNHKKKRLLRCPEGKSCPYQSEYQHNLEYSHCHDDDSNIKNDDKSFVKKSVVPFSGKPFTTCINASTTMRNQHKSSLKRSIPRTVENNDFHLPSKRKKAVSITTPALERINNDLFQQTAKKDSRNDRSAVNICKDISNPSLKKNEIIDLCQEDDDGDDEIQIIDKESDKKSTKKIKKNIIRQNQKHNNNLAENDEVVVDKIVPPPRRSIERAQTYNPRQHILQASSLPNHEQIRKFNEQLELERAIKESNREHLIHSQNNEYEKSLQEDRLKAQKKESQMKFLMSRFQNEDESVSNSIQNVSTIAFRLPLNGQRVTRKFPNTSTAQELYWFVEWLKIDPNNSFSNIPDNFTLKPALGGLEISKEDSLQTLGLHPNGVVFVRGKT